MYTSLTTRHHKLIAVTVSILGGFVILMNMTNAPAWTSIVSTIASCISAAVAVGAVVVASIGLGTWRRQLRGTSEYELAKRLMLQIYKIRDAAQVVRRPFMLRQEAGEVENGTSWEVAAYLNRWKGVREALLDFDTASLEAEVVWGKSILELKSRLNSHVVKLNAAITMFGMAKNDPNFKVDLDEKTLYWHGDEDEYSVELDKIIGEFEEFVRPHLRRTR